MTGRALEEYGGEDSERVGRQVTRVEVASKHQVPECGAAHRVDSRRMIKLAGLHHPTNRKRCETASPLRGLRESRGDPPRDHRRPKRIAHDVAQGRRQTRSQTVDHQAHADRAERQGDER
jgi:hypothetical protein